MSDDTSQSIFIIWSNADPDVAHKAAFMYAHNSLKRGWWERVRLIIWGPSAKLTTEDETIQARIKEMLADGVEVWACRDCTDQYGISETLEALGVTVKYVGQETTDMLRTGWRQLTF